MRTRHVVDDGSGGKKPKYTNALAKETSPYLLQHAHNPVAWQPWSTAAFDEAKRRDVPVFLSIGYSTCHWCHVMEEESFEDEEVAQAINDNFVAIKVDREERPDVDGIYMTAVQALTGHGGWPMSCFLLPDGKPFFAGTYFPARDGDRGSNIGFLTIVRRLGEAWRKDRARIEGSAGEIANELTAMMRAPSATSLPPIDIVDRAVDFFASRYDDAWGGLVPAPKFPSSLPIRVLLRHHARTGDDHSLDMAATTFLKMADGGLCDQVGGGFHRYSTDERWLVPHFEKMLYDNALLVMSGLELRQAFSSRAGSDVNAGVIARVERVVRDTLAYVERDMTSPDGAFYSATDADSLSPEGEREEGRYFTWTLDELVGELTRAPAETTPVFDRARAELVAKAWGVTARGNFEGRAILWRPRPQEITPEIERAFDDAGPILLHARNERPLPLRDDKILAAWNGLMISAFARASFVLDEPRYADVAARAAKFVVERMRAAPAVSSDGALRLQRTFKDGVAKHAGTLEDHAFVVQGLLDLYEACGERRFLDEARDIERTIAAHFEDAGNGGFFLTAADGEVLLAREKPAHDGAEPSGNSVHALNLARLAALYDDASLRKRAERTVAAFGQILARHPGALAEMLIAIEMLHAPLEEIVIALGESASIDDARTLLTPVRRAFRPNRVVAWARGGGDPIAAARDRVAIGGKPTIYVCENGACKLPATTPADVERALTVN